MTDRLLTIALEADAEAEFARRYGKRGWDIRFESGVDALCQCLHNEVFTPHVVVVDVSGISTADFQTFAALAQKVYQSEWIVIVDAGNRSRLEQVKQFAFDCVPVPMDWGHIDHLLPRAVRVARSAHSIRLHMAERSGRYTIDAFVGNSAIVRDLKSLMRKFSDVPIKTLIVTGETGTGKGLVARIIHYTGLRKEGPLVEFNCAAVPRDLMESELFGHEAGAFTGARGRHLGLLEQADGGTLFLDEVGDMALDMQAKLLKAMEDKTLRRLGGERDIAIDVQILAATAVDLEVAVGEGRFREDLYHRLNVYCVSLPPLRERKSDLSELVPRIIAEFNRISKRQVEVIPDAVWQKLMAYDWPGNVRELRNVIERCVMLSTDETFPIEWLQLSERCAPTTNAPGIGEPAKTLTTPLDGSMGLNEMDRYIIQRALEQHDYNIAETARTLKTTRETLRYRIQKYHLQTPA